MVKVRTRARPLGSQGPDRGPVHRGDRRFVLLGALLVLGLAAAHMLRFPVVVDDAFISLRAARSSCP